MRWFCGHCFDSCRRCEKQKVGSGGYRAHTEANEHAKPGEVLNVHVYVHVHVHVHLHVYLYVYVYVCMYVCMFIGTGKRFFLERFFAPSVVCALLCHLGFQASLCADSCPHWVDAADAQPHGTKKRCLFLEINLPGA